MVDLALIRNVRTQFVYLTATLPPTIQARFEEQNNLVNPKVIRASTNRRNLFYMVQRATGRGSLLEEGARRAREGWENSQLLDRARDKIILYVRTKDDAATLAELLCCSQYTADIGTAEQKEELLRMWPASSDQPYMVATSALSVGFDFAHVRLVVHVKEPSSLVDFAQDSDQAGRDRKEAYSLVLLSPTWKPQAAESTAVERRALHRYLLGQDSRRACLSDHLDSEPYWRQRQADEDVVCMRRMQRRPSSRSVFLSVSRAGSSVYRQCSYPGEATSSRARVKPVTGGPARSSRHVSALPGIRRCLGPRLPYVLASVRVL